MTYNVSGGTLNPHAHYTLTVIIIVVAAADAATAVVFTSDITMSM